jgi:hypothetical protein
MFSLQSTYVPFRGRGCDNFCGKAGRLTDLTKVFYTPSTSMVQIYWMAAQYSRQARLRCDLQNVAAWTCADHVANALGEPKQWCAVAVSCDFLLRWLVSSKLPSLVVARNQALPRRCCFNSGIWELIMTSSSSPPTWWTTDANWSSSLSSKCSITLPTLRHGNKNKHDSLAYKSGWANIPHGPCR